MKENGNTVRSHSIGRRVVWGFSCCLLGTVLGIGLPILSAALIASTRFFIPPFGNPFEGLFFIYCISASCIVSGTTGAVSGAVWPDKQSIVKTLIAAIAFDIVTIVWWLCWYLSAYQAVFIVSASIKVLAIRYLKRTPKLDHSEIDPAEAAPERDRLEPFSVGDHVRIIDGPYAGFQGTIKKLDITTRRASVLIHGVENGLTPELSFEILTQDPEAPR